MTGFALEPGDLRVNAVVESDWLGRRRRWLGGLQTWNGDGQDEHAPCEYGGWQEEQWNPTGKGNVRQRRSCRECPLRMGRRLNWASAPEHDRESERRGLEGQAEDQV